MRWTCAGSLSTGRVLLFSLVFLVGVTTALVARVNDDAASLVLAPSYDNTK